jgi:hypothetical protein
MKNSILILSLLLASTPVFAKCEVDGIDMADGENLDAYVVVSEKKARFANKAEFNEALGELHSEFNYSECKNAMIWRYVHARGMKKVYTALISVEDECDGGNSFGVLYFKKQLIGYVNDSYISCK